MRCFLLGQEDGMGCTQMVINESSDQFSFSDDDTESDTDDHLSDETDSNEEEENLKSMTFTERAQIALQKHCDRRRQRGLNRRGMETLVMSELCTGGDLEAWVTHINEASAFESMKNNKTRQVKLSSKAADSTTIHPYNFGVFQSILFQIIITIFVGRLKLGMRHNDLKLSNFLIDPNMFSFDGKHKIRSAQPDTDNFSVMYQCGSLLFNVPFICLSNFLSHKTLTRTKDEAFRFASSFDCDEDPVHRVESHSCKKSLLDCVKTESDLLCIKIADFGNCDLGFATIGSPIEEWHFSTPYLIPIEHIVLGNKSVQAYSGDTWMLGMAILHLLGGPDWWSEVHSSVRCPPGLRDSVMAAVRSIDLNKYYNLSFLNPRWAGGAALLDTLYFYIVMRGWIIVKAEAPAEWSSTSLSGAKNDDGVSNPSPLTKANADTKRVSVSIWDAVTNFFESDAGKAVRIRDEAKFQLGAGNAKGFVQLHAHIDMNTDYQGSAVKKRVNRKGEERTANKFTRAEKKMCGQLLQSLLCFDPKKRPSLHAVLSKYPVFQSIRQKTGISRVTTSKTSLTAAVQIDFDEGQIHNA